MAEALELSAAQIEDGPWIEIIQKMELLYADLARMQTDAERRNEELSRSKAFTDNIIRSLVNSLVVTDGESLITMVNDACARLLGYAKEELLGQPLATDIRRGGRKSIPPWFRALGRRPGGGNFDWSGDRARRPGGVNESL